MKTNNCTVVYPGSFDPPTNGHLDLIIRATKMFKKVIVLVMNNTFKQYTFSVEERIKMLNLVIKKNRLKNVRVEKYNGLLVDYLRKNNLKVVLRGLRAVSDFDYEFQMVLTNRKMFPQMETVYLMPDIKWIYLSSRLVKEISKFGGDISYFVPKAIISIIKQKFEKLK
ncbi:MAG: pantetheine-phosphate adenylyltransferase [Endomicrobiia bacterium]